MSTKKMTTVGMLCSMAVIVNLVIHIPLIPAVSFLCYDPKDVIIIVGGFIYGPGVAVIMSAITSVLELMYRGGTIIDVLMNMISTCTFVLPAAFMYKKYHTKKGAMAGLIIGIIACTCSMLLWNYVVTPIYFGMPREAVVKLLIPGILPFNLIKCGINTVFTLLLYKPFVNTLRRTNLVGKNDYNDNMTRDIVILIIFIVISIVCFVLGFKEII